jgi:hypothetical protein
MRSARFVAACLLLLAASACSANTEQSSSRPEPVARRSRGAGEGTAHRSTAATLGVPPGHLPPVGQCRVWVPGTPPGRQARAGSCQGIERTAPAGSWILYRPTADRRVVHVRTISSERAGRVIRTRIYDVERGTYLRDG